MTDASGADVSGVARAPASLVWIAGLALVGACSVGGGGDMPADPLGVQERLEASGDIVGWQACSVTEREQAQWTDRRRSAGMFSVSGSDAMASHQSAAQAQGPVESYATDGGEVVEYSEFPLGTGDWRPPTSLYDVVISVAGLFDPGAATDALGLTDVTPMSLTDDAGSAYLHYEALPPTTWRASGPDEAWPPASLLGYPLLTVVHAVDIWTDADGRTERIRLRTQDLGRSWAELRFTDDAVSPRGIPALPECPETLDAPAEGWVGFEPWEQQLTVPLQVALDPEGRPYDVVPSEDASVRREAMGTVYTSDGTIVVTSGEALQVDVVGSFDPNTVVDFGSPTDLEVEVIWEVLPDGEQPLGVRLDRPGTTVDRWESWEFGYVTDGGAGGFTTGGVLAEARRRGDTSLSETLSAELEGEFRDITLMDLDGVDGLDTMHFFNGWGDGSFPMAQGLDAGGDTVSLYIFDLRYPWRLAIPDGTPPPNVTTREQEYLECLEGSREVRPDGQCPADEDAF